MDRMPFIFTILFLLLGPIRLIPAFVRLTHDADRGFKRAAALRSILIAAAICAFVVLTGKSLVDKYELSLESLEIAGGLLLLLSAIKVIFPGPALPESKATSHTPMQFAISPLATPTIMSPMGVAAILIFVTLGTRVQGVNEAVFASLAIILVLNFLVMFFIDFLVRIPALFAVLQLFGAVLVFIQVALAVSTILRGLTSLGLFQH